MVSKNGTILCCRYIQNFNEEECAIVENVYFSNLQYNNHTIPIPPTQPTPFLILYDYIGTLYRGVRSTNNCWEASVLCDIKASIHDNVRAVSYTHLTLPTNREV